MTFFYLIEGAFGLLGQRIDPITFVCKKLGELVIKPFNILRTIAWTSCPIYHLVSFVFIGDLNWYTYDPRSKGRYPVFQYLASYKQPRTPSLQV